LRLGDWLVALRFFVKQQCLKQSDNRESKLKIAGSTRFTPTTIFMGSKKRLKQKSVKSAD